MLAYSAPVPTDSNDQPNADVAISTQTLLAAYTLPDPVGNVTNGIITAGAIAMVASLATNTVAFCRAVDSNGGTVCDFDVGIVGSGAAVEFDNLSFQAGSLTTPTAFIIIEG